MKIIFGLGNPGQQYKDNRHNIGYMIVDRFVNEQRVSFKRSFKLAAYIAKKRIEREDVVFVKPRTFMNNSGMCVKKVLNSYKVSVEDILIIYDEVDLPLGDIRFRKKGSAGGHRGMAAAIDALSTEEINRLRVGIEGNRSEDLSDYVLSDFSQQEKEILGEVIERATLACHDWIEQGADFVMRNYNRRGGQ